MSFDLITSELDNHPLVRTISTMQWTWSFYLNGRCLGPDALPTELCRFVVTMCNAQRLWYT